MSESFDVPSGWFVLLIGGSLEANLCQVVILVKLCLSPRQVIICTRACILYTLYAFERIALHKEDCYPTFFTKNFFKNRFQSFYSSVFSKLFTVSPLPHPRAICHSLILLLSFHAHICMMLFKVFKTLYTALALSLFPCTGSVLCTGPVQWGPMHSG